MRGLARDHSWDATVARMESAVFAPRRRGTDAKYENVVIGAGPTGLAATLGLSKDTLLVERADRIGGLCRSIEREGFTFDNAGRVMCSRDPYVRALYERLLGANVHWQPAADVDIPRRSFGTGTHRRDCRNALRLSAARWTAGTHGWLPAAAAGTTAH